jgi:putative hemolysin
LQAPAAFFILIFVFLALSVFFSASETALMAVSRLRLKYQAETGDKRAEFIKRVLSNPDRLLGVILLGNTLTNVGAATLVAYLVAAWAPPDWARAAGLAASALLTVVILIFCELAPKIIAAMHAERASRKLVWPIQLSIWLLAPIAAVAAYVAGRLVRLVGLSTRASPFVHPLSEEEIRSIIAGSSGAVMDRERKEMLHNVFTIGDTLVREVMISRTEVTAVEIDTPISEILGIFRKTNYSRIPVYRKSFENMAGILYSKDLLQCGQRPGDINLQALLRPVHFVPDTARLEAVLRQLQSMHLHMGIVVDEFGGVEGIITLEDLLEEIVGEIRDEHDTETDSMHEIGPGLYSAAGNLPVRDFNRFFEKGEKEAAAGAPREGHGSPTAKLKIPESREYTTVAGFLLARTGRLLQAGESVRYQDMTFVIDKVDGMKIAQVRVRVFAGTAAASAAGKGRS